MEKKKIENAIALGSGREAKVMNEALHEGFFAGAGIFAVTLTDNNNRALMEVRSTLRENGARVADKVSHLFQMKAELEFDVKPEDEEKATEVAMNCPLEDFNFSEGKAMIICEPASYKDCRRIMEEAGFTLTVANYPWIASSEAALSAEDYRLLEEVVEKLEALESVQSVYHNGLPAES